MYEINTIKELLEAVYEMGKEYNAYTTHEYTLEEILDDGFTTGAINPAIKEQIYWTE